MSRDPRISHPHPHKKGYRCEIKTAAGAWRHGPTRPTEQEAVEAAAAKLAELDAAGPVPVQDTAPAPAEAPAPAKDLEPEPEAHAAESGPTAIRIRGPYPHYGYEGFRCRLLVGSDQQWAPTAPTKALALKAAERMKLSLERQGSLLLRDAIEAHVESKRVAGARSSTLDGTRRALTCYFAGILDTPVGRLTPARAQQQYDQLRQLGGPRTGQPLAIATQQTYLGLAKTFARWLVAKAWIREDPTTKVRAVGKRRRGKPQLRADEIVQLRDTCLAEASEGAVAVLMCMLMAMRVSEALSRVVRDIDLGGTILRVDDNLDVRFQTKTDSSKRPIKIPQVLQQPLAQLAAGKGPTDPLFPGSVGGRRRRQYLHEQTKRLCQKAGVPVVCPHSLRGAMATIAVEAGELPEVVARVLGHTSSKMTLAHYVRPGVAEAAQLARGQAALAAATTAPLPA